MNFEPTRGRSGRSRPHIHHSRPEQGDPISIEAPGRRRARGLSGLDDFPRRSRHRGPNAHGDPHGHGHRRGPLHSRRGAIREATLALLSEQPMHGYQVMQELGERSGGRWRPSAGSVYPTLQQLEDEGLVTVEDRDGRRTFALTDAGRTAAAAISADRPWASSEAGDDLRGVARELGIAAVQVNRVGSASARAAARTILTDARRNLYRLLAEDAGEDEPTK
jgi:DNA-binding PadR family transcriptional regulator